ncbi:hypothetical protein FKR81_04370 [Lentzea tibetensis]|uniref:Uncharacterized protein n=1 Tax=Lentzea tibetensis TaxID=2591470 RepID=A0A563F0A0_9PSEU|nr:hypothetical protein [Lentzea tibetensis]TWP53212.1 hypothetical protein FKR81_04370 [Lentzea tibetensis]
MTTAHRVDTDVQARHLHDEYDDLVRRHADHNGVLADGKAVDAAELAHRIYEHHAELADHYQRLSREHREGR